MTRTRAAAERTSPNGSGPDQTPPATTPEDVPLDQIHLDGDTMARLAIDGHIINEYAEAMTEGVCPENLKLFIDLTFFDSLLMLTHWTPLSSVMPW
jgi:hypothetical protein